MVHRQTVRSKSQQGCRRRGLKVLPALGFNAACIERADRKCLAGALYDAVGVSSSQWERYIWLNAFGAGRQSTKTCPKAVGVRVLEFAMRCTLSVADCPGLPVRAPARCCVISSRQAAPDVHRSRLPISSWLGSWNTAMMAFAGSASGSRPKETRLLGRENIRSTWRFLSALWPAAIVHNRLAQQAWKLGAEVDRLVHPRESRSV